ncbi:hypothetical protein Avbf_18040 [Armadillidium vulgare]|nr:hypothetical protein Avbf_18040 [Armadillidium vulgare]
MNPLTMKWKQEKGTTTAIDTSAVAMGISLPLKFKEKSQWTLFNSIPGFFVTKIGSDVYGFFVTKIGSDVYVCNVMK